MSDQFVAEIRIFAGNFAPLGWALCDGQLMVLSQNTALFSLLGTNYGGNGTSNFGLPNLQGSAPMQAGQGPGLSQRFIGENGGEQAVTLLQSEMPIHSHFPVASNAGGGVLSPGPTAVWAGGAGRNPPPRFNSAQNVTMSPFATSITGSSFPHNNMPPFLGLTFIIALQGIFPPRG